MHRDHERLVGLLLANAEHVPHASRTQALVKAITEMLPSHAHDIGAPLRGVEQQREREARLRADRMISLKLRDLIFRPRVESVALDGCELDVCGRVAAQVAALAPKLAKRAQRREPTARRVRWLAVE